MKIILLATDVNEESVEEMVTPMGLLYLAAYIEKYFPEKVDFEIKTALNYSPENDADLIGISSMTRYFPRAVEFARKTKQKREVPVIIGGHHITALPHTLPDCFDIGVLGEGEETFLELLTLFKDKKAFPPEELEKIRGIAFHRDGKAEITPPRPLITDMDRIPFPKRELWNVEEKVKFISSSRGCPFSCIFCALAHSGHRRFSADYVVREVMHVKERYNPDLIIFQDDLFMLNRKRLVEIAAGLKEKGIVKNTHFGVTLRADLIDEETVNLLNEMNAAIVYMGIESGSERILNYLKSGNLKLSQVEEALDMLHEKGIKVEGSFILGAPMETRDDLLATYKFILNKFQEGKLSFAGINLITPYPGSQVWEYAKKLGAVSENMDFSSLNLTLYTFDPYESVYLNEVIPLSEFVDYIDLFEEMHFNINRKVYNSLPEKSRKKYSGRRLDREKLKRFKEEKGVIS
ncbi:MAG: B12-binding domain-containing radical SAM protein [Chloroflexi bacterium]|nr:B12-binding domain-containing radical SAM protein [Chloroflexota bacterium]